MSGGQRQRIAIARAFLKNAPIILLDEPTAALDSESEREVQKALDSLRQGRTTLVVAHRLQTIVNSDRICVIENGKAVEHGTHDELIAARGTYHAFLPRNSAKERRRSESFHLLHVERLGGGADRAVLPFQHHGELHARDGE